MQHSLLLVKVLPGAWDPIPTPPHPEAFQGLPRPQVDRKLGGKLPLLRALEGDILNTKFHRVEGWGPSQRPSVAGTTVSCSLRGPKLSGHGVSLSQ